MGEGVLSVRGLALALAVAAGCGGAPAHDSPAQLKRLDETALLRDLPGGNVALLGGDYGRLQALMLASESHVQPEHKSLVECLQRPDVRTLAGIAHDGDRLVLHVVTSGLRLQDLAECAKRIGLSPHVDADAHYLSIAGPVGKDKGSMAFLALADGALYNRDTGETRATLEADVALAATKNATTDAALIDLTKQTDRTKTVWFVGLGAGTLFAGKVVHATGWLQVDSDRGFQGSITAELSDRELLDSVLHRYHQVLTRSARDSDSRVSAGVDVKTEGNHQVVTLHWSGPDLAKVIAGLAPRHVNDDLIRVALSKMGEFADRMCECHDAPCAQGVSDDMTRWGQEQAKLPYRDWKITEAQQREMAEVTERMTKCMTSAMGATP